MNMFSLLKELKVLKDNLETQYNAALLGNHVRVSYSKSGSSVSVFSVGPQATHAIMQGTNVSVFYKKGGVKVYTKNGSFQSMSGICN
jgi:hypothetical protein